jgi:integrase
MSLNKFQEFVRTKHNFDFNQLFRQFDERSLDPISILDEFYTFLSSYKLKNGNIGYRNSTITTIFVTAKEFLNSHNLHIYNEDLKQRIRLPKKEQTFEVGLTKEILVRLLHNSSYLMQTAILMCISSGMRVGELVQLRISDIDFTTNPTTIRLRKETTKTRETRFTCISSEATKSLKDYLIKKFNWYEGIKEDRYIFMRNENYSDSQQYYRAVKSAECTLGQALWLTVKSVPDLAMKNENGRYNIHFHAFRAWFKTQVTNAHQSDFAEAMMGHKSLKLVYYRQNAKDRQKTYLEVEPALTISDFTRVENTIEDLQKQVEFLTTELEKVKQWREISERYEKINYH